MAKIWMRIAMTLIFVFTTLSSPVHAQAMAQSHQAAVSASATMADMKMSGMSEECAKAMMAQAKAKPGKAAPDGQSGGCCSNGCNCPLSHCPATPPMLITELVVFSPFALAQVVMPNDAVTTSFHTDALKRPPRA